MQADEQDESLVIAHRGLPLGISKQDPLVPPGDSWWQPMTDDEAGIWIEGR
jgi:hypothetical protein